LSYRGKPKGSYGQQRHGTSTFKSFGKGKPNADTLKALRSFEHTSDQHSAKDLMKFAEITPTVIVYLQAWRGISNSEMKRIMESKGDKAKAEKLALIARRRGSAKLMIQDNSKKGKVSRHHFKIVKKKATKEPEKAKEIVKEAEKELAKAETKIIKEESHLPSEKEILDRAQQLYQKENFKGKYEDSAVEQLPTKGELSEEGYLQAAKLDLMTKTDTKASRDVMDYVEGIKNELEKIGFTVEPLAGFDVTDLKY
jgi:hypothetical protein